MKVFIKNLIIKFFKIIILISLVLPSSIILPSSITFAAVKGFVDSKQVNPKDVQWE